MHVKGRPALVFTTDPSSHIALEIEFHNDCKIIPNQPSFYLQHLMLIQAFHKEHNSHPLSRRDIRVCYNYMYIGQNFVISLQPRYLFITLTSKLICAELSCVPNQEKTVSCHGRAVWPKFKVGHSFRCLN